LEWTERFAREVGEGEESDAPSQMRVALGNGEELVVKNRPSAQAVDVVVVVEKRE